jgi:DNA-binding NarL/FixJ family response regulator
VDSRTVGGQSVCDHWYEQMSPTVLIVDDHPSFRSLARAILEAEGFDVIGEAEDASAAVHLTAELEPDVVLLDVALPDGDGIELAGRLRRIDGAGPTVVLVSSRDRSDYGSSLDTCGAAGFIPKDELSGRALADLIR